MSRSRRPLITAVPLTLVALLTACVGAPGDAPRTSLPPTASAYPITVDNCGTEVTFESAPERVLAIKSTSIEMLLALGLEDRIVGIAFSDGPPSDEWADRAEGLPVVSDRVPGQEATLELEPDLVYAGWESNVSADGAGERDALASLGVDTYVSPAACQSPEYQPRPLTFDDVFDDVLELGGVFDATDRAEALVASQRERLDAIVPDERGLTALWFSSGADTPFVGAGIGAPQMMMDAAGLVNIAAGIDATWSSLGWEAVVDADPDVIVLVDSAWSTAETKIGMLEGNAATAQLRAVREERYLVLPFPSAEAGVRNVEAVESLVAQLAGLDGR